MSHHIHNQEVVMNNKFFLFTFLFIMVTAFAVSQPAPQKKMMKELKLTDTQKEQFEKNAFDKQKRQIELKAKLETFKLELRRLLTAETIDKTAIEKKMNDIASQQVALHMNNLNTWTENNKLLNAEQQKIWKTMLKLHMQMMERHEQGRMQGPMMHKKHRMENEMRPHMERKIEKEIIKE